MTISFRLTLKPITVWLVASAITYGNTLTNGPAGINSTVLGLNGAGVAIGQVEDSRPGKRGNPPADNNASSNATIEPTAVFLQGSAAAPPANMNIAEHSEDVAGVMISTDATLSGVSPAASLYSAAYVTQGTAGYTNALLATQNIATQTGMRAINNSWGKPLTAGAELDGNSQLSLGMDWIANRYDVLNVVAGNEGTGGIPLPTDSFNGIVIGASTQNAGVFNQVATFNNFSELPPSGRSLVSLIAPGDNIAMAGLNGATITDSGTSFAAPMVTGTVALLQQYAAAHSLGADARRHQVMKAILMNSADKLIDNGTITLPGQTTPAPAGTFLGMEKTALNQSGTNWLQSPAYDDGIEQGGQQPLDFQMGAGALNAHRAQQQLAAGKFSSVDAGGTDVPALGWDFDHTTGMDSHNRYQFDRPLQGGDFISITLAWDRHVTFATDTAPVGVFNAGDSFNPSTADPDISPEDDDLINGMELYLLPKGAATITDSIALSVSAIGTVQHIFFQIPTTGDYEFWVRQSDEDIPGEQNYAVAWWAANALTATNQGDYDHDGMVTAADYTVWKMAFGTANPNVDGNGDGIVDAADYTIWRDHLGQMVSGSGSAAMVPEPSAFLLFGFAIVLTGIRKSRRANTVQGGRCVRLFAICESLYPC